ncbi:unnamed protein product [Sphenostylis stenocarpa]|uniref:Uncharacterized protein n=1 Tax=Sphenostylis stenocarpa TaxID=92480 RepID=A0AA86VBJ2_9FABA|nr:unnamed protein product [Sphenostylis stenocarpa]
MGFSKTQLVKVKEIIRGKFDNSNDGFFSRNWVLSVFMTPNSMLVFQTLRALLLAPQGLQNHSLRWKICMIGVM